MHLGSPRAHSFLADDLLDILQQSGAIDNRRCRVLYDPLLADHSLRIDEKERPVRGHRRFVENPVAADDLPFRKIAEQRERQLQGVGEGLLRERRVGTDGEVLDTQGFEALVVGLPGRQVCRSGRSEVRAVKFDEDPFLASEVVQGNVEPRGGRQLEVGRLVAHLNGPGSAGQAQHTSQQ